MPDRQFRSWGGLGTAPFRRSISLVKMIFLSIALCFLAWVVWHARSSLLELLSTADISSLGLAVLFGIAAHLFAPVCSVAALRMVGIDYLYHSALLIHVRNLPARYIPGGVWHTVGRAHDFLASGMRKSDLTALLLFESALPVGVGLALSCSLLLGISHPGPERLFILIAGALLGFVALSLLPIVISRMTSTPIRLIFGTSYLKLIGIYLVAWIFLGGMFTCYLLAFGVIEGWSGLIYLCAIYIFAWSVGFIAIFAPQGIGVFEVTAASFLPIELELTTTIAIVTSFRLVPIITDLVVWAVYSQDGHCTSELFSPVERGCTCELKRSGNI